MSPPEADKVISSFKIMPGNFVFACTLFTRAMGVVYFIAFFSLLIQIEGLVGEQGILPASTYLDMIHKHYGLNSYWHLPTIFWLSASDSFLKIVCFAGMALALGVIGGLLQPLLLFILWFFYLSLTNICQDFTHFQWDILLLEVGFLTIFIAPWKLIGGFDNPKLPSKWLVFLFYFLLFKLMFSSGMVKIASGDPSWRNLTALNFHYFTQPLPHFVSWYFHQLPSWFQKGSVLLMYFGELICPLMIFLSRKTRTLAAIIIVSLMMLMMLTGNYGFFNLIAMALCLFLIDDQTWQRWFKKLKISTVVQPLHFSLIKKIPFIFFVTFMFLISFITFTTRFYPKYSYPSLVQKTLLLLTPFKLTSSYGLFSWMTKTRPEIIIEGSEDGITWHAYEFKYKPGDILRAPAFVIPHMPRLDWQMWFAALDGLHQERVPGWFRLFVKRLLEGSDAVIQLLSSNPFPHYPPQYIRARLFDYQFTNFPTKRKNKSWWQREFIKDYVPAVKLRFFRK